MIEIMRGGSAPNSGGIIRHGQVVQEYNTVRHGWADRIEPKEGEVGVLLHSGSPECFAVWAVGPEDEIRSHAEYGTVLARREHRRATLSAPVPCIAGVRCDDLAE